MEQRAHGLDVWQEPFVPLRVPKIYNLRTDPFERADVDAIVFYEKWMADRAFVLVPAQVIVAEFLQDVRGVPAAAEARQLQHRPGARESPAEPDGDGHARRRRGKVTLEG